MLVRSVWNGTPSAGNARPRTWGRDDSPLLHLSATDVLKVIHSFEGFFCTGQTGAGKTTAIGEALGIAMMRSQFGFVVCCSKPEDAKTCIRLAVQAGREEDLRVFGVGRPWRLNLLDYAYHQAGTRGAEDTENVLALVTDVLEFQQKKGRGDSGGDQASFWTLSARKKLGHWIDLLACANEIISFANINRIMQSEPNSMDEVKSQEWQEKSYLNQLVDRAVANKNLSQSKQIDLRRAIEYGLWVLPRQDERLRSSVSATCDSLTFLFLRGTLAELVDGKTNLTPEDTFANESGAIIILDLPVKEFGVTGQLVQIMWKRLFQQAAERRDVQKFPRPLCLHIDEAQNFCTHYDLLFQATARSSHVATVLMTQNLDSLQSQLGKSETQGLLASLNTKLFLSNDHVPTNEWAAKMIGQYWALGTNTNVSLADGGNASGGVSEQLRYVVDPSEFMKLKKGGVENNGLVEGILFRAGRPFRASNANYLRLVFPQALNRTESSGQENGHA
jgi:hypothetical protein